MLKIQTLAGNEVGTVGASKSFQNLRKEKMMQGAGNGTQGLFQTREIQI